MLYPPYIESKLPAQYGSTLKIPFRLNRTQSPADIAGKEFTALIKTVTTNRVIGTIADCVWSDNSSYYVQVELGSTALVVGQYYKIQLAYEGSTLYSTVGIFKYTNKPIAQIGFDTTGFNVIGTYSCADATEKIYMYKFDCTDGENLIESSGWRIHNSLMDTSSVQSQDEYQFSAFFDTNKAFFDVTYRIKTINNIEIASEPLRIDQIWNTPETVVENISIDPNGEQGSITIAYTQPEASDFFLVRQSERGFEVLKRMSNIQNSKINMTYTDYNLEQGDWYMYYLYQLQSSTPYYQQLNEKEILIDFEDMFLQDKDFILRIRYNPKMQSFKTVIMENKIETLGSQYPIVLRNGNINYKEFSISGLLVAPESLNTVERQQTNSINSISEFTEADSIYRERVYKLEVLDWLNNGKPKLFRSSTEGNYIVRLMNVSLSPEVQLGRKLHTFSATAYEIAPYNTQSLIDNNIIEG